MTIALFATIAFIVVARGGRWAYGLSVPIRTVVYMLFDYLPFFFTCLIRGLLGLPIAKRPDMGVVGGVCTAGIALACAAFLTAPYLRKSPAKKHREASAGGP